MTEPKKKTSLGEKLSNITAWGLAITIGVIGFCAVIFTVFVLPFLIGNNVFTKKKSLAPWQTWRRDGRDREEYGYNGGEEYGYNGGERGWDVGNDYFRTKR